MDVVLRAASPDDAPAIGEIFSASWKTAYAGMVPQEYLDGLNADHWIPRLRKDLAEGKLQASILLENGVPAGAIGYGKSRDEKLADWGEIVCIYVHPGYFRRGYGARLLREAVKNLGQEGCRDCFLWVLAENKNAQNFYTAMGLQKTEDLTHSELMGKRLTEIRYILKEK